MATIVPYINFGNKSLEAIDYYKAIFGGDAEIQVDGGKVVQLEFKAGNIHFMGSDLKDEQIGLESLVLNCDNEEQLRDFYTKLANGGKEVFVPQDSGWGAIVAHCTDQFGVTWMLNYDKI